MKPLGGTAFVNSEATVVVVVCSERMKEPSQQWRDFFLQIVKENERNVF